MPQAGSRTRDFAEMAVEVGDELEGFGVFLFRLVAEFWRRRLRFPWRRRWCRGF